MSGSAATSSLPMAATPYKSLASLKVMSVVHPSCCRNNAAKSCSGGDDSSAEEEEAAVVFFAVMESSVVVVGCLVVVVVVGKAKILVMVVVVADVVGTTVNVRTVGTLRTARRRQWVVKRFIKPKE